MQWNFYVSQRWSVFGEPGLVIFHGFLNDNCPSNVPCHEPSETSVEPAIFVGGRYHDVSDTTSTHAPARLSLVFGGRYSFFL